MRSSLHFFWRFSIFLSTFFKGIYFIKLKLISFFNARCTTVSLRGPVLNLTARAKPEFRCLRPFIKYKETCSDGIDRHGSHEGFSLCGYFYISEIRYHCDPQRFMIIQELISSFSRSYFDDPMIPKPKSQHSYYAMTIHRIAVTYFFRLYRFRRCNQLPN